MTNIPRRTQIDKNTAEELLIRNAVQEVEKLGAHPKLTQVIVLLDGARDELADWVDAPEKTETMRKFEHVMEIIRQERKRQTEKWGDQDHSDAMWLAIFLEEVGEVAKALVEAHAKGSGDAYPMRQELVHAVAVGVQWLEKL